MTYLLTEILNVEHCQGFDDIGGICYYLSFRAFQQLKSEPDPQLQAISLALDQNHLVEGVALALYQHFINVMIPWFTDAPQFTAQQGESLTGLSERLLRICSEICPASYEILQKVEAPVELFVVRVARTLFSREMEIEQLKHLWDFVLVDGHRSGEPLRMVGELTALFLVDYLSDYIQKWPNCDINECQQALFQQNKKFDEHQQEWRKYLSQLQFITQRTSKHFVLRQELKFDFLRPLKGNFYQKAEKPQGKWEQLQSWQLGVSWQLSMLLGQFLRLQTDFNPEEFQFCLEALKKGDCWSGESFGAGVGKFDDEFELQVEKRQEKLLEIGMKICENQKMVEVLMKNAKK